MKRKSRYVFKKNPILVFDLLKAKKRPSKSKKFFLLQSKDVIFNDYNVNKLAKKLHPLKQNVIINNIIDYGHDYKVFEFKGDNCNLAFFRAGQYVTVNINIDGVNISRPYSICSSPKEALEQNIYRVGVKYVENGFFSKYLFEKAKIGDKCWLSGPEGEFYYDDLRDRKNVLAVAGGVGITPFISFIKDIIENNLDINFTLLFSAKTKNDLLFFDDLMQFNKHEKINVVCYTTREKNDDCINKRIDFDEFKRHYNNHTIFICGNKPLCNAILEFAEDMKIERKLIRYETNEVVKLTNESDYVNVGNKNTYKIKVNIFDKIYEINAKADESILVSLQKAKIHTQSKCLSGKCAWCRIRLISGKVFVPKSLDHRRIADANNNIYHSCVTYPVSDLEIESY